MTISESYLRQSIEWHAYFTQVFDLIHNVYFWAKDSSGIFIMGNTPFAHLCGKSTMDELLGKSDYDIWPRHLADNYVKDDRKVMQSGKNVVNRLELILNPEGTTHWHQTTKIPLYAKTQDLIGVIGYSVDLKKADANLQPVMQMAPVIETIKKRYMEPLEITDLAKIMCMSLSSFERKFKKYFKETPIKYLNRIRIEASCQLLANSDLSISEIAMQTGFYDQSHFSKCFFKYMGKYPSAYRKYYTSPPPA